MAEMSTPAQPIELDPPVDIPEGIRKARANLRRDLPSLLASRWTRGKWACYSAQGKVAIGRNYRKLIRECNRRGIPPDDWIIERIEPGAGSDIEEDISR